jgi:myo-inositol 2-dehydrogenase/D-chiro-inositol 1-dehydrogenase
MLQIGLIGAGQAATAHARALRGHADAKVAFVHCRTDARRRAFAAEHGAEPVAHSEELIARADAILIASPGGSQAAYAEAALAAAKPVFSEKPGAVTVSQAERIAALGGFYQYGVNRRFAPVYVRARAVLADGLTPTSYTARIDRGELQRPSWVSDRAVSGGYGRETVLHMIDLVHHLFGPVRRLEVARSRRVYDEVDNLSVLVEHASGVHGLLASCAHATWIAPFEELRVHGAHATLQTHELKALEVRQGLGAETLRETFTELSAEARWGFEAELRAFVAAVQDPARRSELPGPADLLTALRAVEVIFGA